jgi:hypothetical protein
MCPSVDGSLWGLRPENREGTDPRTGSVNALACIVMKNGVAFDMLREAQKVE